ncbi:MAG: phospholipase D-like domain-containing protein [bacterium]
MEIIQSPQKEDWLIKYIDGAQKEIKIAIYMFTVPSLREALLRAKNRGVTVQVILEKNPYNAVTINRETVQFFQKNSIDFYETDNRYFSFMHAKYMIIDTNWILATANWTRSSFSSNREFFIIGTDSNILKDLENVFQTDFKGGK